jgi:glycosyltransferase involved in cell wall biosynthesis
MRILHVIDTTGPGGAETLFVELCKRFNEAGDSSIALLRGPGWVGDQLNKNGIVNFQADCKGSFNILFLRYLMRLIRSERIDVIQSHLLGSNVYCSLAGWLTGTPVVATFHGSVDIAKQERMLRTKFALINRASAIVSVSEMLRDDLMTRTPARRDRITLIKNGIDCSRFDKPKHALLKRQYDLPDDAFVVGALGNIRPAKDYPTALRALARAAAVDPRIHLLIAGDIKHALHAELLRLAEELQVARQVRFIGFVEPAEDFLAGLDLYLLSSKSEGHPFSVIQAMAAGLPILATRCGVETMLADNDTGVLVPAEQPEPLARKILELAAAPERRQALGEAARRHALATYDFTTTAKSYAELYRKAVD